MLYHGSGTEASHPFFYSIKFISNKLFVSVLLTLATLGPGAVHADDYIHTIQYELQFGNRTPVSNIYMSMQPDGAGQALSLNENAAPVMRTPIYSTNPYRLTLLNPVIISRAVEENGESTDAESDNSATDPSVGEFVGGVFGIVLIFGPIVYGIAEGIKDISEIDPCRDGCGIEIPEFPDLPAPPPDSGS